MITPHDFECSRLAGLSLLQRQEAARAELLASVLSAKEEGDRDGYLSGEETPFPPMASFGNRLSMRSYSLMEIVTDPPRRARGVQYVLDGLASGALTAKIARTFTLDHSVEAHRYMEGNEQIGKIVVTV